MLEQEKKQAAEQAIGLVKDGMIIGLGSGSTVALVLSALAERIKAGLQVRGVPSSLETARLATAVKIPLVSMEEAFKAGGIELTIDGTDEFDPQLNLIKGGGGALLREKMLALASRQLVIVADSSKQVLQIGKQLLPLEIASFGWQQTAERLNKLGFKTQLRKIAGQTFITDNSGYILDCNCGYLPQPQKTETILSTVPGVLETGLFCNMTDLVLVGQGTKVIALSR